MTFNAFMHFFFYYYFGSNVLAKLQLFFFFFFSELFNLKYLPFNLKLTSRYVLCNLCIQVPWFIAYFTIYQRSYFTLQVMGFMFQLLG